MYKCNGAHSDPCMTKNTSWLHLELQLAIPRRKLHPNADERKNLEAKETPLNEHPEVSTDPAQATITEPKDEINLELPDDFILLNISQRQIFV